MSTQTINISLPKDLVKLIDDIAVEEFTTRSDIIRQQLLNRVKSRTNKLEKEALRAQAYLLESAKVLEKYNFTDEQIDEFAYTARKSS